MHFTCDDTFNSSHKMGEVRNVTKESLTKKLGTPSFDDGMYGDDKVDVEWSGMVVIDGAEYRTSVWDWKGSLQHGKYASVWIDDPTMLHVFIKWIES